MWVNYLIILWQKTVIVQLYINYLDDKSYMNGSWWYKIECILNPTIDDQQILPKYIFSKNWVQQP